MQAEEAFIEKHRKQNLAEVALSLSKQPDLDKDFILRQINGWQKAKAKLPTWAHTEGLHYPPAISMEQCSSEATAQFKAQLFKGTSLMDLTGGFGVDSYYLSKSFDQVHYIEPYLPLFEVVQHNFQLLRANNIELHQQTAESFLEEQQGQQFDYCYIDPSRRNADQKVFLLADCQPNIVELSSQIFELCPKIVVKTSPLLDLKQSIAELGQVAEVHVVALKNECKELLFVMQKDFEGVTKIYTHNIKASTTDSFSFNYQEESEAIIEYSDPLAYLYEPNVAILKGGGFRMIAKHFGLQKIAPHSHLYSSDQLIEDFPGRKFKVEQQLPFQPKAFKKLGIKKANLTTRNFKATVEQIRKKLKLKTGGEDYIFATTLKDDSSVLLVCKKV
jgi:hypothetical protein